MTTPVLARRSPDTPRPRVLFVDGSSRGTSRLAAALLRQLVGDRVEVAAVLPRAEADRDPVAERLITAAGLDPAEHPARPLSATALRRADRVISLGASVDVAQVPGPRYEVWDTIELEAVDAQQRGAGRQALTERLHVLATELTAVATPVPAPSLGSRLRSLLDRRLGR